MIRRYIRCATEMLGDARTFIHAPVDARIVAVIRIGYAGLMLINVLCWWPDLDRWFSDVGPLPLDVSRRLIDSRCLTLFQVLPADPLTVRLVYGIFVAQLLSLLVGFRPRFQAACCYVWLVSFQHRNTLIFEGEDTLFRIMGFLLIFMPLGNAWSVDRWLRNLDANARRPMIVDGWAVRLLQLEMAMLYFSAAWSKLLGEPWRDGTALYYVSRLDDYWGRFPILAFLVETPWIVRGLTWSTMGLEFAIPVMIWFPPTRRLALVMVLIFHLACDYTMHLFLFHWVMLLGWVSFVQPGDFRWLRAARAITER